MGSLRWGLCAASLLLLGSSSRSATELEDETARDTRGVTEQSRTARRAIKPLYHGPITIGI